MSSSLAPECNEVKDRYDSCFLKWYSEKFLRGNATTDECEPLFKEYKTCLSKALKERGIDVMLAEARENNKDINAEHMKGIDRCESIALSLEDGLMGGRTTPDARDDD